MTKNSKKGAGYKALLSAVLTLTALAGLAPRSHAAALEDVQLRVLNAIPSAARSNSANVGEGAINLSYVGTSTEALVTVSATAMTFYIPSGPDSTIGTSGVITYATTSGASTIGGLCDYINGLYTAGTAKYICRMTGAKRDDLPILLADQTATVGTNDMKTAGGFNLQFEGLSTLGSGSAFIMRLGITPTTGRRVVLRKCATYNAGTGTLLVYGKLRKYEGVNDGVTRNDSTQIWTEPTANATALSRDWSIAGGTGGGIEFGVNEHVVVSAGNASTQQLAADYLECGWEER